MTTKSKRDELFDLADNVVDAIFNMPDEEIIAELDAEGVSVEDAAKAFDSLMDSARLKAGRKSLLNARQEMDASRRSSGGQKPVTATEARDLIARAAKELPQMTQAARNAKSGEMPDREVFELLEDLRELGVSFTKDHKQ